MTTAGNDTSAALAKPIRSFVAVSLPAEVRARLMAAAQELASELPAVRWTRKAENLHITVKFLGDIPEAKLAVFGAALAAALAPLPAFEIAIAGLGAFRSLRRASVVWAGVEDASGALAEVASIVERIAAETDVSADAVPGLSDQRVFRAHVTVGRAKTPVDARLPLARHGVARFGTAPVEAVAVYESRLGGGAATDGSTYVLRHRAALGSKASN
jgi:RNA 2',3'-cyclic 3'-phosphodiesterase